MLPAFSRIMNRKICWGLLLASLFFATFCQSLAIITDSLQSRDLPSSIHHDFIRLSFHSSTRAGSKIYIDGGEINFLGSDGGNGSEIVTLNNTLTLDLTKSWKTSDVQFQSINKTDSVPILNYGALWPSADGSSIFSFGGVRSSYPYPPTISAIKMWQYSQQGGWIGLTSQGPASPTLTGSRPAAAANTFGGGTGYMLGGVRGNTHAPYLPLPGLLIYNMANNTWSNESTASLTPFGMVGGSLTLASLFGSNGILVAMGGEYTGPSSWMDTATNYVPFTNISIWDIASKTWYWQPATGNRNSSDIPPSATMFCTTGAQGPNGTLEIFVYGGHSDTFVLSSQAPSDADMQAQEKFNAVYVLSLPSFVWTKVSSTDATPRTGHTCNLIGNRQMLSIGGLDPTWSIDDAQTSADTWSQGLGIFDMVSLKWTNYYDVTDNAYVTPDIVNNWYTSHDVSTIPWSSDAVKALFMPQIIAHNGTQPSSAQDSGIPSGSIAPIIAVCVVLLCAVLFLGVCFRRYCCTCGRRRARESLHSTDSTGDNLAIELQRHNEQEHAQRTREAREEYLTQRDAFIQNVQAGPHVPAITAPSLQSSQHPQWHNGPSETDKSSTSDPAYSVRPSFQTSRTTQGLSTMPISPLSGDGSRQFSELSATNPSGPMTVFPPRVSSRPLQPETVSNYTPSRISQSSSRYDDSDGDDGSRASIMTRFPGGPDWAKQMKRQAKKAESQRRPAELE